MTRNAPLLTLLAVAVLGGGLLATNYVTTPVPAAGPVAAPAAVSAPVAEPAADRQTGTVPVPGVVAPSRPPPLPRHRRRPHCRRRSPTPAGPRAGG